MTNPLDDLSHFSSASLPKSHSSGRRELRAALLSRGIPIRARARTAEEQQAAILRGEACATLPIKRAVPKVKGKKKLRKKLRAAREQAAK